MTFETWRSTAAGPSSVQSRHDFAAFVEAALADSTIGGAADQWEYASLERFLDAVAAVSSARVADRDAASQEAASWQLFVELLATANGYE